MLWNCVHCSPQKLNNNILLTAGSISLKMAFCEMCARSYWGEIFRFLLLYCSLCDHLYSASSNPIFCPQVLDRPTRLRLTMSRTVCAGRLRCHTHWPSVRHSTIKEMCKCRLCGTKPSKVSSFSGYGELYNFWATIHWGELYFLCDDLKGCTVGIKLFASFWITKTSRKAKNSWKFVFIYLHVQLQEI